MPVNVVEIVRDDIGQAVIPPNGKGARLDQHGRMCSTTTKEMVQDAKVITCTLLVHSTLVVVLFDSSSTHTFISKIFVYRIGVPGDDLGFDLVVSTTSRAVLTTRVCVRDISVIILWHILLTIFIELSMRQFDVIFSMD